MVQDALQDIVGIISGALGKSGVRSCLLPCSRLSSR